MGRRPLFWACQVTAWPLGFLLLVGALAALIGPRLLGR